MARKYTTLSGRGGPPNPIDIHVGTRIRLQRRLLGMTQQEFAKALGLTFQQVQKYEHGMNRIAASRLFDVSRVLGVDIIFFFEDMPAEVIGKSPSQLAGIKIENKSVKDSGGKDDFELDPMHKQETLELVRNYYRLPNDEMRKTVFDLCKTMAKELVGRKPGQKNKSKKKKN